MSGPSWYDVLGVEPTADADEVRAAWKAGIAELEPGDRRFTVLNEAAGVLLDPRKRAAYDASLAPAPAEPTPATTVVEEGRPARLETSSVVQEGQRRPRGPRVSRRPRPASSTDGATAAAAGRRVPVWLLAVLALLLVAVSGTAAYLWTSVPSDEELADGAREARSAAERAIVPVLSYDHRTLEEDRAAAVAYLTDDYREEYEQLFAAIEENAPDTETVVEAQVLSSGLVRVQEGRVSVLLFVDRPTTNRVETEPIVYRDQVTVTMEEVDGRWLVDGLATTPAGG